MLTPRLLVLTARVGHARLKPAASKFSRPSRQLWTRLPSPCSVTAEFWNDFTVGVLSDRHPEEQFLHGHGMPVDLMPISPVEQYAPRISGGVNSGVSEVVSAVKYQRQCSSCSVFSVTQAVELQLVLTSGEFRVDLRFNAYFTCELGCLRGGRCRHVSGSVWTVLGVLCYSGCGSQLVLASSGYSWICRELHAVHCYVLLVVDVFVFMQRRLGGPRMSSWTSP